LLVTLPNPHPGAPTCPSTTKMLRVRECAPTPYPFVVFTFRLVVEPTKEFGSASLLVLVKKIMGRDGVTWRL